MMRVSMNYALLAITAVWLTGCTAAHSDRATFDAIVAANRELMDRMNRGDRAGVARMYADDAVLLGPNNYRVEGRAAIDEYWTRDKATARWKLEVLSVECPADMPVQRGRSILETQRDGVWKSSDVQFLVIWRRQPDGGYRVAVDAYWSSEPKP